MKFSHVFLFVFLSVFYNAQTVKDHLIQEVSNYFDDFNKTLLATPINHQEVNLSLFNTQHHPISNYQDSLYDLQIDFLKKDIGLTFKANTRFNINDNFIDFDEDGQSSKYQIKAGIEWNVFKEGFKNNLLNKSILENEQSIHNLNQVLINNEIQYQSRYQLIMVQFNATMQTELTRQLKLFEKQLKLFTTLYYHNLVQYTTIIELKKKIESTHLYLKKIHHFNNQFSFDIHSSDTFGVFDINLEQLIRSYEANQLESHILKLQKENLHHSHKKQHLVDFRLFAEYQFRATQENETQLNPFIGARLNIPIISSKKKKSQTIILQEKLLEEKSTFQKDNTIKKISNHYYEYQYHLKQLKELYYQLYTEIESVKTHTFIKNETFKDLNLLSSSFHHQNRILDIRREMLDLKRLLYLKALKIFTLTNLSERELFSNQIISKVNWNALYKQNINIIIDTEKDLNDIQFLTHYLKRKGFKKVFLKKSVSDKYTLTRKLLKMEGFLLLDEINHQSKIVVTKYSSSADLFKSIEHINHEIFLDNLHDLIKLEMKTIKNQLQ